MQKMLSILVAVALAAAFDSAAPAVAAGDYDAALGQLAMQFSAELATAHIRAVSVLDFTDLQGTPTELGRLLAEDFSIKLVSSQKQFDVIDRQNVQFLLKEHNLSQEGFINPQTRRELGNLIGIDTVVTGTSTPLGNQIRLSVRAVSVETGKIVAAAMATVQLTSELENLNNRGLSQTDEVEDKPKGAAPIRATQYLMIGLSSITGAKAESNRPAAVATFSFRNTGSRPILLALNRGGDPFCADFHLTDGRGGFCRACANGEVLSSLPVVSPGSMGFSYKGLAQVPPMSTIEHVLNFHQRMCSTPLASRSGLSISGSFLVDEGGGLRRVPISFSAVNVISVGEDKR